jgi:SAM-dependent methyltransferase
MIGIDYSLKSLRDIDNYKFKFQADALALPFRDGCLDGIISSYFWEHIAPADKIIMLKEFHRVLKPGGKVVMLYDVETENKLIGYLKKDDLKLYDKLFKEGDYHIGYETMAENEAKFRNANFKVLRHFGMERSLYQSSSVYIKMQNLPTTYGRISKWLAKLSQNRLMSYLNVFALRVVDETAGRLLDRDKSRIAISVLKK